MPDHTITFLVFYVPIREGSIVENQELTQIFMNYMHDSPQDFIFSSQRSCRALRMLIGLCVWIWILKRKKELRDLKIAKRFFD